MADTLQPEADERWKAVCAHADTSSDPITAMLREAGERLDRDPPDLLGAKVSLHGARLAVSSEALAAQPATQLSEMREALIDLIDSDEAYAANVMDENRIWLAGILADRILAALNTSRKG